MGQKFYDTELHCEVEVVDYRGRPAVALRFYGPLKLKMTFPLSDAETMADMLIAAVRTAEQKAEPDAGG